MAFLDKFFRWKKKPFREEAPKDSKEPKAAKDGAESAHGSGKYAHIIVRPHTSEKSAGGQELNQYVFEVVPFATKREIARAVNDIYGVSPDSVNVINMRGKYARFGRTSGTTRAWKKAIITLPEGRSIDVYKK